MSNRRAVRCCSRVSVPGDRGEPGEAPVLLLLTLFGVLGRGGAAMGYCFGGVG